MAPNWNRLCWIEIECAQTKLSEEEGLGMVNGLIWGEGESSRKIKGQLKPNCGGCFSSGYEDSWLYLRVMCARWADGEEGVILSSEGRGIGPEDGHSGVGPQNLIRIYFFL